MAHTITVHLPPAIAREVRSGNATSTEAKQVLETAGKLKVHLKATHAEADDDALVEAFSIQAKDARHADEIVKQLQARGIRAYRMPAPQMP
jgi:hypothetical protein